MIEDQIVSSAPTPADAALGHRLTALTMGVDQLERRISAGNGALDSEGLVPIYLGAEVVAPLELQHCDEALEQISDLKREAQTYPSGSRQTFLLAKPS